MITKKQLEIFKAFRTNPFKSFSFSDLKKELEESSSSKLQNAITVFKDEGLINLTEFGRTKMISLNFNNNKLFSYFSIYLTEFYGYMPFDILYELQCKILNEEEFFSLVVFGSYVSGKQKKSSDLDIAVIVSCNDIKKKILPLVKSVKRKTLVEIHEMIFTRDEFLQMLSVNEENVGKEIARNNFVFYGLTEFYKLILKESKWRA
jgi:predicted nucleotidyltransferase